MDTQPFQAPRGSLMPALNAWEARPMSPAEFSMRADGYGQDQTWFSGNDQFQDPWESAQRGGSPERSAARLGSPQQEQDYLAMGMY